MKEKYKMKLMLIHFKIKLQSFTTLPFCMYNIKYRIKSFFLFCFTTFLYVFCVVDMPNIVSFSLFLLFLRYCFVSRNKCSCCYLVYMLCKLQQTTTNTSSNNNSNNKFRTLSFRSVVARQICAQRDREGYTHTFQS